MTLTYCMPYYSVELSYVMQQFNQEHVGRCCIANETDPAHAVKTGNMTIHSQLVNHLGIVSAFAVAEPVSHYEKTKKNLKPLVSFLFKY